jgi:hypothetical protein
MKLLMENFKKFLNEVKEKTASVEEIEKVILAVLKKEGGAAGLKPIEDALSKLDKELPEGFDLMDHLKKMKDSIVKIHDDGDVIEMGGLEEGLETIEEAEYKGRKVKLNKRLPGDVKKSKVYVKGCGKDPSRVTKINFGDKKMKIKKSNPKRRKSFRARHKCHTAKDKCTARYWSCKAW